ncbi:hypothetical protein CapIbe_011003 [Capra ibex]
MVAATPPVIHVDLTAPKAFLRIFAEKEVFPSGPRQKTWTCKPGKLSAKPTTELWDSGGSKGSPSATL